MKLRIDIDLDNAAFDDDGAGVEIARILRKYASKVDGEHRDDLNGATLRDYNACLARDGAR